jgi:hypothetical protein
LEQIVLKICFCPLHSLPHHWLYRKFNAQTFMIVKIKFCFRVLPCINSFLLLVIVKNFKLCPRFCHSTTTRYGSRMWSNVRLH